MKNTILKTNFKFPGQESIYHGKVRDVYYLNNDTLIVIVTDRISAFDKILPNGIPFKGQVLNQIASKFLDNTSDIVPNWKISTPDPMVTIGKKCEPFKIEMVIRGYLTGHAWREYSAGKSNICGIPFPKNMKEHDKFKTPLITPTTKASHGHDEDISKEEIIKTNLVSKQDYELLEKYTLELFERGKKIAKDMGLILVDTKYEFGKDSDGNITLIDEIHTPDSSRYFYLDKYQYNQDNNLPQKQLSKEFVRQWLISRGFQGKDNQVIPEMDIDFIESVSNRYIELYEKITGDKFRKTDINNVNERVERNILSHL